MPHVNVKVVSAFFSFSQITTLQKLQLILIVFFVCITQSNVEACTLNKAKEKNELVGPVHTVITKMRFDTTTDTYDPSGNLVESVTNWSYEKDSRQSKVMFTCDQQGRLTMEVTFHSDGSGSSRKLYGYGFDERGNQTAVVAAMDDGSYAHAEFSTYDDKGNLVTKLYFTGRGFFDKSVFDVQGKVVYATHYRDNTLKFESWKYYNPQGQLGESLYFYYGPGGKLIRKDQYKYDDAGKLIEESSEFDGNFRLSKAVTRYEYDGAGNWIRQTVQEWKRGSDLNEPVSAEVYKERTITYY